MHVTVLTLALLITSAVAVSAAVRQLQGDGGDESGKAQQPLYRTLRNSSDFTIFIKLVEDSEGFLLKSLLFTPSPGKTVFAPTDTGFANTAEDLGYTGNKTDTDAVRAFILNGVSGRAMRDGIPTGRALYLTLLYHISNFRQSSKQVLQSVTIETFLEKDDDSPPLTIGRSSERPLTLIDRAPAITDPNLIEGMLDIPSSNGVIHAIDRMLHSAPITEELFDVFRNPDGPQAADDVEDEPASSDSPDTAQSPDDPEESSAPVSGRSPGESGGAPDERDEGSACFSASATVHLSDGSDKPMHAVVAGDFIRHSTKETNAHSKVYAFSHRESAGLHDFVRIESESGHVLIASRNHYVYANGRLVVAAAVKEGDVLTTLDGPARVGEVKMVKEEGLYAPHTMHGDIVVDRVLASSYTQTLHPTLAYFILAPVRLVARMGVKEPLGKLLYEGADQIAEWVPAGPTYI